jgi:hypothetical protein
VSIDPPPSNPADAGNSAPPPTSWHPGYPQPGYAPATGYGAHPGYGWAPAPPYPPAYPPVRKRPPKKYWYALGAAVAMIGLIVCGVGIAMVVNSMGAQPDGAHTFKSGETTTVHIDSGETMLVYVANADAAGGHHVRCGAAGQDGQAVPMKQYQDKLMLNQWEATFTVTPTQSGEYTFGCTGAPIDTFGVGEDPGVRTIFTDVMTSIAGGFLILLGIAVLTVTAVLRHRRSA